MAKKRKGRARKARKPVRKSPSASGIKSAPVQEFNPDYSYVIQDLKRIGTITATFLVILVALSFILR